MSDVPGWVPHNMSWLDNNGESAVKKLKNSLPLRKELDHLKDELSHQLQLSDIRMYSNIHRLVRGECSGPCDARNRGCPSSLGKVPLTVMSLPFSVPNQPSPLSEKAKAIPAHSGLCFESHAACRWSFHYSCMSLAHPCSSLLPKLCSALV
ncbi:hypothetical protein CB1_001003001 [Camelus ferus]|nr:hypothetical protein CB1_001003001 [Camelus ferus]